MIHMLAVRTRMREALETLLALEGLLAAVQTLVLRQVMLVFESLGAHVALVGTLTCQQNIKIDTWRLAHVLDHLRI